MIYTDSSKKTQQLNSPLDKSSFTFPKQHLSDFSPIPGWLNRRKEVKGDAKRVYARLLQYAGKNDFAYPKRKTLWEALGMPRRSLDRRIRELKDHNLIHVIRNGKKRPNTYYFPTHIWMGEKLSGELPNEHQKWVSELPNVATTSRIEHCLKDNIYIEKSTQEEEQPPRAEHLNKFDEFWKAFPKRIGDKKYLLKKFCQASKKVGAEKIIEAAKIYDKTFWLTNADDKYCLSPLRWLKEERWTDEHTYKGKPVTVVNYASPILEKEIEVEGINFTETDAINAFKNEIKEKFIKTFNEGAYISWIKPLFIGTRDGKEQNNLTIVSYMSFAKDWVENHYLSFMKRIANQLGISIDLIHIKNVSIDHERKVA
jgi:hypothetical protein